MSIPSFFDIVPKRVDRAIHFDYEEKNEFWFNAGVMMPVLPKD